MNTINIGIPVNLQKLLATRLLIQAGSGGGKSYALRKTVESVAAAGGVQQIIIDPEGEFVTLREKFDFVLVGKDGDIPLSLKYAETLAHKLLETGVSAVIDLYEMKKHERTLFVKRFLEAVMNAPKSLWHECLFYIDEAHDFCPQASQSESTSAVIDLCTRGRKRGFAAVLATQRLSKLHKDAAAECLNKMVGRTGLDIDRQRASEELGRTSKTDVLQLRDLVPGEFYTFGPAISNEVLKFKIGTVVTTHPEAGQRLITKPATPKAIARILEKLSGIPEEAEKDLTTRQQLQTEVARLRGELSRVSRPIPAHGKSVIPDPKIQQGLIDKAVEVARVGINREYQAIVKGHQDTVRSAQDQVKKLQAIISKIGQLAGSPSSQPGSFQTMSFTNSIHPYATGKVLKSAEKYQAFNSKPVQSEKKSPAQEEGDRTLGKCSKEILIFLATHPDREWSKAQVGVATGYSPGSGGFNNSLSELTVMQLIYRNNGNLRVSAERWGYTLKIVGPVESREYDISTFKDKLSKCEREIYEVLLEFPHDTFSKDSLAAKTPSNYSPGSGGFNNSLSRLTTLELIERNNGAIRLNPELLELMN